LSLLFVLCLIFYQFLDTLILKCFNDGLTPNLAEKNIIEKKGKNWTLLSAIKRRFEELCKELREEFVIIIYLFETRL